MTCYSRRRGQIERLENEWVWFNSWQLGMCVSIFPTHTCIESERRVPRVIALIKSGKYVLSQFNQSSTSNMYNQICCFFFFLFFQCQPIPIESKKDTCICLYVQGVKYQIGWWIVHMSGKPWTHENYLYISGSTKRWKRFWGDSEKKENYLEVWPVMVDQDPQTWYEYNMNLED